jgi:hypothetical protein
LLNENEILLSGINSKKHLNTFPTNQNRELKIGLIKVSWDLTVGNLAAATRKTTLEKR